MRAAVGGPLLAAVRRPLLFPFLLTVSLLLLSDSHARGPGPRALGAKTPLAALSPEDRVRVVRRASALLLERYVFPHLAEDVARALEDGFRIGRPDHVADADALAEALCSRIRDVSGDGHLWVSHQPGPYPPPAPTPPTAEEVEAQRRHLAASNFGFPRAEVRSGNVGVLEIRQFVLPSHGAEGAVAALSSLGNVDALILDLRRRLPDSFLGTGADLRPHRFVHLLRRRGAGLHPEEREGGGGGGGADGRGRPPGRRRRPGRRNPILDPGCPPARYFHSSRRFGLPVREVRRGPGPTRFTVSERVPDGEYVGKALARRRVAGLTLAETRYAPGAVISPHVHGTPIVAQVTAGAMTEERERRALLVETGSLIYQPPDETHGHRFHRTGGGCFLLQFGEPWTRRMEELEVLRPSVPLDLRRGRGNWIVDRIREEFHAPDEAAALAIEGLSVVLLGELRRSGDRTREGARPGWLIRVLEVLHASLDDLPPLAEIAARVGIHPAHLSRTFSRFQGCTMGEYVRRLRVERAAEALRKTDRPISAVALDAGFADQAHFTRVFKRLMGETPARYRAYR